MKTITRLKVKFVLGFSVANMLVTGGATVAISQTSTGGTILLNDGTKLTSLGVTTGTQQMAPGYENLATANRLYTPNKTPMLWIQSENKSNQYPTYEIIVCDKAKTACVNIEKSTSSHVRNGVNIQGFILKAFPRWDKEFIVRVRPYHGEICKGQFVVSNPVPVVAAMSWTADSLPATKSDGDLEVTLTKFVAGAPLPYRQGENPATNDLTKQCVHLNFDFRENGKAITNWSAWPVETFDALGNYTRGLIYEYPTNGIIPEYDRSHPQPYSPPPRDGYFYQPGLWPDKSPWKVRLEFSRSSGYSADELWSVTNIPVQPGNQEDVDKDWAAGMSATNFVFAETTIGGIHLKLYRGLQFSARSDGQKHISVLIKADPIPRTKGIKLTMFKATDEQGRELQFFWGGTTVNYPFEPTWVHDAKSLNLTLAVQKERFVEFTIHPEKE